MHGRAARTPLAKRVGPGYHDDVNLALKERAGLLDTCSRSCARRSVGVSE